MPIEMEPRWRKYKLIIKKKHEKRKKKDNRIQDESVILEDVM